MQFRQQTKKIQCIRVAYDQSVQRCRQIVIASLRSLADELPSDQIGGLTESERRALAECVADKKSRELAAANQYRVSMGGQTLAEMAAASRWRLPLPDQRSRM